MDAPPTWKMATIRSTTVMRWVAENSSSIRGNKQQDASAEQNRSERQCDQDGPTETLRTRIHRSTGDSQSLCSRSNYTGREMLVRIEEVHVPVPRPALIPAAAQSNRLRRERFYRVVNRRDTGSAGAGASLDRARRSSAGAEDRLVHAVSGSVGCSSSAGIASGASGPQRYWRR